MIKFSGVYECVEADGERPISNPDPEKYFVFDKKNWIWRSTFDMGNSIYRTVEILYAGGAAMATARDMPRGKWIRTYNDGDIAHLRKCGLTRRESYDLIQLGEAYGL